MMSGSARGRKALSDSLVRLSEGDGELIRERNIRSKKDNFSQNTGGLLSLIHISEPTRPY